MLSTSRLGFWSMERFASFHDAGSIGAPLGARWHTDADGPEGGGAADNGSDRAPEDQEQPPSAAEILSSLQDENQRLKERIEQLSTLQDEARSAAQRLEDTVEANDQLRRRYREVALTDAVRQAADNLGVPAEVAAVYSHRFDCEIDNDGAVQVTPNPTEFLLAELKSDPLLQQSVSHAKQVRQAAAVANGTESVDNADPVQLMTVLDRDPSKKARFIARQGMQSYVDLAAKARRKGYRD